MIVDGLIDAMDPGLVECGNELGVGQKLDREQPEVETTLVGLRGMLVDCGALVAGITPRGADAEVVLVAAVPFGHDAEMGGPAGADDTVGELVAGIGYSTEEHEALGLSFQAEFNRASDLRLLVGAQQDGRGTVDREIVTVKEDTAVDHQIFPGEGLALRREQVVVAESFDGVAGKNRCNLAGFETSDHRISSFCLGRCSIRGT